MNKFIAKSNGLCFTIEADNNKARFFAVKSGDSYQTKKNVTPDTPVEQTIINEISRRQVMSDPMSDNLRNFIAELEKNYADK